MTAPLLDSRRRALHWVLKIGNLKTSLNFFEKVLGLKVLRHEEFDSGCEATCNGPYAGAWSKTMIGYGPERENFALELTYNYGIESYPFGNDLQHIALHGDVAQFQNRAKEQGYAVSQEAGGGVVIQGPDSYKYKVVPTIAGRRETFLGVALRTADIAKCEDYWANVLGLQKLRPFPGTETTDPSLTLGFAPEQAALQFIQVGDGQAVDHAKSSGRIAFACTSVPPIFERVKAQGDVIQTPPLTLPTPGKADVVVTILVDRDGYEICFVEDEAFYDLATPTYDIVDFAARAKKGGDGHPPPTLKQAQGEAGTQPLQSVTDKEELDQVFASAGEGKVVVLDFGAGWCKNCKTIMPLMHELAATYQGSAVVVSVDVDEADELTGEYGVSSIPRLLFFKGGKKVGDYVGSNANEIKEHFATTTAT